MVSLLGIAVFGSAFAVALWAMIVTIAPRLDQIRAVLGLGETIPALPALPPRSTVRGAPVRVAALPAHLRAAA